MSLTLKLFSLVTRTAAKPIGNYIKRQAREHERFRKGCISFAQQLHRLDMHMRLGLLQDSATIERLIKREAVEAEEKRLRAQQGAAIPTAKTEQQSKADDAAKEQDRKLIEGRIKSEGKSRGMRMIRPLSESKAIELGSNFISETFVFGVAVSLLLFETWRSRRKDAGRREDTKEQIDKLEDALQLEQKERGLLEEQLGSIRDEVERLKQGPRSRAGPGTDALPVPEQSSEVEKGHASETPRVSVS